MASVDITGGSGPQTFVSGAYLSAYGTQNQNLSTPYFINDLRINTTVLSNGISIQGTNNTDIVFSAAGNYNIQFSAQVTNNNVQEHEFYLWLCKFGISQAYTNSVITIPPTHGGVKGHHIAAWNFVIQAAAADSFQLCWSADNIAIAIETIPSPGTNIPISPSVILSVTQV